METVLVTGGAGFIGSHLSQALLQTGREVVVLDNLSDFYDPAIKLRNLGELKGRPGFTFVEGDILDRETVRSTIAGHGVGGVVHLAALAGVRPSLERPARYAEVNVTGTAVLLEEAVRAGAARFVFASSSSVYGERKDPPFRETDRVDHPVSPYAATKKAGELLCHTFHQSSGIDVTCLRYFTVHGPRQRPEMAIHKFARRIMAGEPIALYGDGSSARDYTFVDDIVAGTVAALDRCGGYRVYNLGGSKTTTLLELVGILGRAIGREPVVEFRPVQTGDVPLTSACIDRAAEELDYRPKVGVEEGVGKFVDWMRS